MNTKRGIQEYDESDNIEKKRRIFLVFLFAFGNLKQRGANSVEIRFGEVRQ